MKKKSEVKPKAKKQAARFDNPPVYDGPPENGAAFASNEDLSPDESAAEFVAAEEEQRGKEKKEKAQAVHSGRVLSQEKPVLGKGQKYFEAPDGRLLVGPEDAGSITDPVTGQEINPMRHASPRLHR